MLDRGVYHHHKSRRWMGAMSLEAGQAGSLVQRPRLNQVGSVGKERSLVGDIQHGGWKSVGTAGLWRAGEKGPA